MATTWYGHAVLLFPKEFTLPELVWFKKSGTAYLATK